MKRIFRHFLIEALALYFINKNVNGLIFDGGLKTFALASAAITLATLFGKPVINVLLLPLNLVTFGLFRWVSSAIALYLVTLLVDGFRVAAFNYGGYVSKWLEIPSVSLRGIPAFIAFSFLISLLTSFLHWLRR
ncbi:phage holin family protein [Candidatus Woesebacteria bacterium]|nr:MAG: phage holin family protein [Candidatus Woesebacteria bacterium]